MKILLINPPFERFKKTDNGYFPLGLGYLAAILEKENHFVRIYNADMGPETKNFKTFTVLNRMKDHKIYLDALKNDEHYVWKEIRKVFIEFKPNVVCFSCTSDAYASALKISKIIKKEDPNCKIVFGGVHSTLLYSQVIKKSSIDFLIRGEGEKAIVELVNAIEKKSGFEKIKGLSYKDKDKIIHNESRELMENLDDLPLPAKHLVLFPELYRPADMNLIIASRGCPFSCIFCASSKFWGRRYRTRSVEDIIHELKFIIKTYNIKHFRFWDDIFTANKSKVIELCKSIIKEKINKKVHWNCLTRIDVLDNEMLYWMKKAGCTKLCLGLESGSDKVLKGMNKHITVDQIRKAVKNFRKKGFLIHGYFMCGLPFEEEEDIKKTIKLIKEIKPDVTMACILVPYPGTKVYQDLVEMGKLPENYDWEIPLDPNKGWTEIPQEKFEKLALELIMTARKVSDKNVLHLMKMAWIYRTSLLQNPVRILQEVRERIFKK